MRAGNELPEGFKFSKSLLNAYDDYKAAKLCGFVFDAQYIRKTISTPTGDAQALGIWFEYWATGGMPAYPDKSWPIDPVHGIQMPPIDYSAAGLNHKVTTGKGKNKVVTPAPYYEMLAPFKRAKKQAEKFKYHCEKMGIEIISVGDRITLDDCSGVLDIRARRRGVEMKIDLKYTGLIDNRWEEMGWDKLSLPSKHKLISQPFMYNLIEPETPFAFMLYSSGADEDVKFYQINISPSSMEAFKETLHDKKEMLKMDVLNGFRAYPSYAGCMKCPLRKNCKHFIDYPDIEEIDL